MTAVRKELKRRRRSIARWTPLVAIAVALVLVLPAMASHPEVSLPGSDFEIDTDANLKRDDPAPSIDWASVSEDRKADLASGSGDNSFGQGTKEDTPVPTVVTGSIPPQKSDLLTFGVYLETTASGARFLNLFWHRVQEPQGTTNMDFEFNQSRTLSSNNVTPVRTSGDLLIQYDLSRGGTSPTLFLSRWIDGSESPPATAADCEASNSLPCWSKKVNLTAAGDATGSINTSAIPVAESDGLAIDIDGNGTLDPLSPRTFGEAQLDFDALTGGTQRCVAFGSAYLKSRSSDSFVSELKDFIAPLNLSIDQCGTVIIRKQTDPEEDPNTTSFGYTKAFPTDPSTPNTFTLMDDGVQRYDDIVLFGSGYTVDEDVIPAGWDLVNINCDASTGVTPVIDIPAGTVTFAIDANTDVLDCTYTNRTRGQINILKTDDTGAVLAGVRFDLFKDNPPLGPPRGPEDTATGLFCVTSALGVCSISNVIPGQYWVVEDVSTLPPGHNAAPDQNVVVGAGATVSLTFVDPRERGAIRVTKTRKHAAAGPGDHPHAGVDFVISGGSLASPRTITTGADGKACLDGLVLSGFVGNYTVHEVTPAGYHGEADKTVTVDNEATCTEVPYIGEEVSFHNTPLTDITVTVDSQVAGGTSSTIDCDPVTPGPDAGPGEDISHSLPNREPGTYTCTIVVDP
jgi:Prealbumin-like fold domain